MSTADKREPVLPPSLGGAGMRVITVQAAVRELKDDEVTVAHLARIASWMPMVSEGEPTKLHITAWLAHEGMNNNRLAFRAEDLPASAEKIGGANLLPMDWNHSAVIPQYDYEKGTDIPKAIGVWYDAKVKMNPAAKNGAGALGIEAKGVVWAWAFPDHAKEMLAMQQHRGHVEFSMACIPSAVEIASDENGRYEVAIEPIFFTLSALNVPPADPDAKGMIEDKVEEDMPGRATQHAAGQVAFDKATASGDAPKANEDQPRVEAHHGQRAQEDVMAENTQKALDLALEANELLKVDNEALKTEKVTVEASLSDIEAKLAQAQADADDAALTRDALQTELTTANEKLAALVADLEAASAQLVEVSAKEEKAAREARWVARFQELPESYRTAFAKRSDEEQARFVERWSNASEEAWGEFQGDLLVAFADTKISYLDLSLKEGKLPNSADEGSDLGARIAALTK